MQMISRFLRIGGVILALAAHLNSGAAQSPGMDIEAFGLRSGRDTDDRVLLRVEEEPTGRVAPLLPYVFFADGSAELDSRYRGGDSMVTSDRFVRTYRRILEVIGDRMRRWPDEDLVLTGTSSGAGSDKRARGIGLRRAQAVAAALAERYGVARSRIVVRGRGLPARPSNSSHAEGQAENRRVEVSGSERLLAPVPVADSFLVASSPGIRLLPSIDRQLDDSARWRVELRHAGKLYRRLSGHAPVPEVFDETFTDTELRWFADEGLDVIEYRMVVNTDRDSVVVGPKFIRIDVQRTRRQLNRATERPQDRESIVLFGFDSDEPIAGSRAVLEDLLSRIPADARAAVVGFTDETGSHDHNVALSRRRAEVIAAMLGSRVDTIHGAGESGGLHWNMTPEDRFYSRVVRIAVR